LGRSTLLTVILNLFGILLKSRFCGASNVFKKNGTFYEKVDGITGGKGAGSHYPNQSGFGWTNAVIYRYINILDSIESGEEIYAMPKSKEPPFKMVIPH